MSNPLSILKSTANKYQKRVSSFRLNGGSANNNKKVITENVNDILIIISSQSYPEYKQITSLVHGWKKYVNPSTWFLRKMRKHIKSKKCMQM